MCNTLYIVLLIFLGIAILIKILRLLDQHKMCDIFGHDWERISLDSVYNKKNNTMYTTIKYKCTNCGKTKTEKHIDIIE